jgi:hypothetical protein
MEPNISPAPIIAKTRPKAAPAVGLPFLWIAGEEDSIANAKNRPNPKNGSPKRNANIAPALDGWATPKL